MTLKKHFNYSCVTHVTSTFVFSKMNKFVRVFYTLFVAILLFISLGVVCHKFNVNMKMNKLNLSPDFKNNKAQYDDFKAYLESTVAFADYSYVNLDNLDHIFIPSLVVNFSHNVLEHCFNERWSKLNQKGLYLNVLDLEEEFHFIHSRLIEMDIPDWYLEILLKRYFQYYNCRAIL